jgi:hypothetical protein
MLMTDNVIVVARHLTFGLTCSEHHTAPGTNQLLKFSARIFVDITNFPALQAATSWDRFSPESKLSKQTLLDWVKNKRNKWK